jgi:hypothetical protein
VQPVNAAANAGANPPANVSANIAANAAANVANVLHKQNVTGNTRQNTGVLPIYGSINTY